MMGAMRVHQFVLILSVAYLISGDNGSNNGDNNKQPTDQYLAYLFHKYGSRGVIPFEGLEHLMHNLGLGAIEFSPVHTINEHRPNGFKVPEIKFDNFQAITTASHIEQDNGENNDNDNDNHNKNNNNDDSDDNSDDNSDDDDAGSNESTKSDKHRNKQNHRPQSLNVSPPTLLPSPDDTNNQKNEPKSSQHTNDNDENLAPHPDAAVDPLLGDEELNFKPLHDPKHRHPRHHDHHHQSSAMKACLSPIELLRLHNLAHRVDESLSANKQRNYIHQEMDNGNRNGEQRIDAMAVDHNGHGNKHRRNVNNKFVEIVWQTNGKIRRSIREYDVRITPDVFRHICPALLSQIDLGVCNNDIVNGDNDVVVEHKINESAWIYASISILIISLCGLLGVGIVPLTKSIAYNEILNFLVALAVGTLCGDALMHLLPHALANHGDKPQQAQQRQVDSSIDSHHDEIWLCGCVFLSVFIMYSLEKALPLLTGSRASNSHGHSHSWTKADGAHQHKHEHDFELDQGTDRKEMTVMLDDQGSLKPQQKLSPVAVMVIFGDGLHNLTDGLAIGAAFGADPITGFATAFAVLCHELPHELGDFALLLKTGVSIKRALFLNMISSLLSLAGMTAGLVIAGMYASTVRWIYAATAGSFLYIALADLIPEMAKEEQCVKSVLSQIAGILLGGLIMLTIAINEDRIRVLFE